MGVKLLMTIARKYAFICDDVNILDIIREHRSDPNIRPVIVIDGKNVIRKGFCKGLSFVHGGQVKQLRHRIRHFVEMIRDAGGDVVVFIDGYQPSHKFKISVRGNIESWTSVNDFFVTLANNNAPKIGNVELPFNMTASLVEAFQSMGCEVYFPTASDSDKVMAKYVFENKCLGILAEDSDYLIFNAAPYYFDSFSLDWQTFTTKTYNVKKLVSYLNLDVEQLPLLAIVAGNDIVPADTLKDFHARQFKKVNPRGVCLEFFNVGDLYKSLADFIRPYSVKTFIENAPTIAQEMFGSMENYQLLIEGVNEYSLLTDVKEVEVIPNDLSCSEAWCETLKAVAQLPHLMLFNLLATRSTVLSMKYVFVQEYKELCSSKVNAAFKKKWFGILFQDNNPEEPVKMYVFDTHEMPTGDCELLIPQAPPIKHPGLPSLLSGTASEHVYNILRTWLFEIDMSYLKEIPRRLWIPLVMCRYFYNNARSIFRCYEIDALLCSTISLEEYSADKIEKMITYALDLRGTSVYTMFTCLYGTLFQAFYLLNIKGEDIQFHQFQDGIVFHRFYGLAKDGFTAKDLFKGKAELYQIYLRMQNAIKSPLPDLSLLTEDACGS